MVWGRMLREGRPGVETPARTTIGAASPDGGGRVAPDGLPVGALRGDGRRPLRRSLRQPAVWRALQLDEGPPRAALPPRRDHHGWRGRHGWRDRHGFGIGMLR